MKFKKRMFILTFIINLWIFSGAYSAHILEWKLDEGSGNIAYDSSDNRNDGDIFGSPEWIDGYELKGLSLDGEDDYIFSDNTVSDNPNFTIAFWMKAGWQYYDFVYNEYNSSAWRPSISFRDGTEGKLQIFANDNNKNSKFTFKSNSSVFNNNWHHIALVANSSEGTVKLYVDGVLDNQTSYTYSATSLTNNSVGAKEASENFYNGAIDELNIFTHCLTEQEIVDLYAIETGNKVAVLRDSAISGIDISRIDGYISELESAGYQVDGLNSDELSDSNIFNIYEYNTLILTQSPLFPLSAKDSVLRFLKRGGDLVCMDGVLPWLTDSGDRRELAANIFDYDYGHNWYDSAVEIRSCKDQNIVSSYNISGDFEGISAVGPKMPTEVAFLPLLDAVDNYGRSKGWAMGMMIHYDGVFQNGKWALLGVTTDSFYDDRYFPDLLVELINSMQNQNLVEDALAANQASMNFELLLTSSKPHGPVMVGTDGKSLEVDGERLHITGINSNGNFNHGMISWIGKDEFNAELLLKDFENLSNYGINAQRIWHNPAIVDKSPADCNALREAARRYGIYLLLESHGVGDQSEGFEDIDDIKAEQQNMAEFYKDEPMILGFDLKNEVKVAELMLILYDGQNLLLDAHPYTNPDFQGLFNKDWVDAHWENPPDFLSVPDWCTNDPNLAKDLLAAASTWGSYCQWANISKVSDISGYEGYLPVNSEYTPIIDLYDQTMEWWITEVKSAIKEADPNRLVTAGHNKALGLLPATGYLDFLAFHSYNNSNTNTFEDTVTNLTVPRRWDKGFDFPFIRGEFGYSNGLYMNDQYVDLYAGGTGEIAHFIYEWNKGYCGTMKWKGFDKHISLRRRAAVWGDYYDIDTFINNSKFGLFLNDGTDTGKPKPVAHGLKYFRDYIDNGGQKGRMVFRDANLPPNLNYTFEAPQAVFIGDTNQVYSPFDCYDNFEFYADTSELQQYWVDENPVTVSSLELEEVYNGIQAMKLDYDLTQDPWYGKTSTVFSPSISLYENDKLAVSLKGQTGGEDVKLVVISDVGGSLYASETEPFSINAVWQEYVFEQSDFTESQGSWNNGPVDWTQIDKISIAPQKSGDDQGIFYVDDLGVRLGEAFWFESSKTANIMISWDDTENVIHIMSTADANLTIIPSQLTGWDEWIDGEETVRGFTGNVNNYGNGVINIKMLEGEGVYLMNGNNDPVFEDQIDLAEGMVGNSYSETLEDKVNDTDPCETITFSKISGPDWLTVNENGSLSGEPEKYDSGYNDFTVRAHDSYGGYCDTVITILVGIAGDFTDNYLVGFKDLSTFANSWLISDSLTILNYGFETPELNDGFIYSMIPDNWTGTGSVKLKNPSDSQWSGMYPSQEVPQGNQIVTISGGEIYQEVGTIESESSYVLNVETGLPDGSGSEDLKIRLVAYNQGVETELATIEIQSNSVVSEQGTQLISGQWVGQKLVWKSSESPGLAGRTLRVYLEGSSVDFDNVDVSYTNGKVDLNEDGKISFADYAIFADNFNIY